MTGRRHTTPVSPAEANRAFGDRGARPPGETLLEVAMEVRRCLAASPPDGHEALRWVARFIAVFERAPSGRRAAMVVEEPPLTGDGRWDALLAATAEHLCHHSGLPVPVWSGAPARFLEHWWFVSPYRSVHASALVATPAALANRGVLLHADSLASV